MNTLCSTRVTASPAEAKGREASTEHQQNPSPAAAAPARSSCARARSAHLNMAGLRLAASSFVVLLFAAASSASPSSRPPAVYGVGAAWRAGPVINDGTDQMLSYWLYVGDVLDFKGMNDSVLLVRQGDYERCIAASPARRRFAGGGDTRFTLAHPGVFYFISGEPARCEAGHRMVVRAVDDARSSLGGGAGAGAAPTPAPAPAPVSGMWVPTVSDTPSNDPPIPVWLKLLVPALIGFLAGCFLAGVIMWLCVNVRRRRPPR